MQDLTAEKIIFQQLSAHFLYNFQDLCYTISALISEEATVQDYKALH